MSVEKAVENLIRKLKAALGIGSILGIAFGAVGTALGVLLSTTSLFSSPLGLGVVFGVTGLILGAGFGGLLSVMERRRTLDDLTTRRAALWGFVVGAGVTLVGMVLVWGLTDVVGIAESILGFPIPIGLQLTALAANAASYGAITAGLAAGTVSLAKRSPSELQSGSEGSAQDPLVSIEP